MTCQLGFAFLDLFLKYISFSPSSSKYAFSNPSSIGIRPKLRHPSMITESTGISTIPSNIVRFDDFLIVEKNIAKSRLFHLFGIESPGLTSSLDIAEYIRRAMVDL